MTWHTEVGVRTVRGPGKSHNEDTAAVGTLLLAADPRAALTIQPPSGSPLVVLLADGMGGHVGGRAASRLIADSLTNDERMHDGSQGIVEALNAAHEALYAAMREAPNLSGMGSTVVGVVIPPSGTATAFNVGDSRLLLRDPEVGIVQLSVDDAERTGTGTGSVLTQCLGGTTERVRIAPHVIDVDIRSADRLLLCSDGLTDVVGPEEIAAHLAVRQVAADVADALVESARVAGARDDVTVVVVDLADPDYAR